MRYKIVEYKDGEFAVFKEREMMNGDIEWEYKESFASFDDAKEYAYKSNFKRVVVSEEIIDV